MTVNEVADGKCVTSGFPAGRSPVRLYRGFAAALTVLAFSNGISQAAVVRRDNPPANPPVAPPVTPATPAAPPATPASTAPSATAQTPQEPIWRDPETGISLYAGISDDMFPASWRAAPISASATAPTAEEAARGLRILQAALQKYPVALLKASLERVYIVGDLQYYDIHAAGTNSGDSVYIRLNSSSELYTDAFVEGTFHHEFAHMLRRNYSNIWDGDAWAACNPPGFRYGSLSGVDAVRNGRTSQRLSDEWNRQGFVSEYAASDISEDFAVVGGHLFSGDPRLWAAVDRNPPLLAKFRVAIGFYGRMDASMTEAYFRSLKPGVAPEPRPVMPVSHLPPSGVAAPASPPAAPPVSTGPAKSSPKAP